MSLFTRTPLPANSPFGIAPAAWISRVTAETLGKQTASPGCFDEPAGDHARRRIPDRIDAGGERRGLHVNPPRGRLEREFDGRAEPARHRQAGYHPLVIVSKIPFPRDTQVSSTSWPGKGSAANVISKPDAAAGRRFTSTSLVIISLSCVFVRNIPGDASSESIAGSRNHLVSEAEAFAARLDGRPLVGPANRAECWGYFTAPWRVVYGCSVS